MATWRAPSEVCPASYTKVPGREAFRVKVRLAPGATPVVEVVASKPLVRSGAGTPGTASDSGVASWLWTTRSTVEPWSTTSSGPGRVGLPDAAPDQPQMGKVRPTSCTVPVRA